ncbi:hypothetical protein A6F68_02173 [Tsuneonella dongtanensis]|uniref:Nitrogen regulatory protein P-II n=1 Tax=Tsuneonella dongtanensis TaxID=692370 RepID=A0A1B2AEV4_9SPHN|nr:DUF190 domain-containing protein [Tsuneonella dongtanensis]ANY20674.1 hypothetical protein A6F68_02173 [Tsuneonella dongtanensis]
MVETVTRKRLEILSDTPLVRVVTQAIEDAGISGWTVVPVTSGRGREGRWNEERVTGADKSLVLAIASEEKANILIDRLAPILTSHGLLLTMANVQVVRGERF